MYITLFIYSIYMLAIHTLNTLISLADKEEEIIRKQLENLNTNKNEEIKTLEHLRQNYNDYQERFDNKKVNGINLVDWKNYYMYIEFLTTHIKDQELVIEKLQTIIDNEQLNWNEIHKKQIMYGKLNAQKQLADQQALNKIEQKQQDEWTSRQHFDKTQESA